MSLAKKSNSQKSHQEVNNLHQGDCVQLINDQDLFQVIGVDNSHQKCWVRRFPLLTNGSPVFEIPTSQVIIPTV